MASLKLFSAATSIFLLIFTPLITAQAPPLTRSCPTITASASLPAAYCHYAPVFCVVPLCLYLSTVSVPCGCPTTIPTSTSYYPCATTCAIHGCGTAYETVVPTPRCTTTTTTKKLTTTSSWISYPIDTSSTKKTTTPTTTTKVSYPPLTTTPIKTMSPTAPCPTVTITTGTSCPKPPTWCSYVPDCIVLSSVTSRCGCGTGTGTKGVVETTRCRTTCIQGCLTQYLTVTNAGEKPCLPTP